MSEIAFSHAWKNVALLREALTHRSAVPRRNGRAALVRSNERLEFIGDRVLGLLVAEWLAERFPDESEGLLARRLAELVAEPQLAKIAVELGVPLRLHVAPNEARAGVGHGQAVIADALEAILGALYADGGLPAARTLVRSAWAADLAAQQTAPKHPKSDLKEWLEARGVALPAFIEDERTGPAHALMFSVSVSAMGRTGRGVANTKQLAERQAALDLLGQLNGDA